MDRYQRDRWEKLFDQARHDLEEEECGNALKTADLDELNSSLKRTATVYSQHAIVGLVEKLRPSLQHIQTFTSAISSAVQYDPVACLVWGSMQAVLQVCCLVASPELRHSVSRWLMA